MIELLWIKRLHQEFRGICYDFNVEHLPKPLIQVSPLGSQWGYFDPTTRSIVISRALIEGYSWDKVLEVFKHEIAHYLVHMDGNDLFESAHGPSFKKYCQRLGILPWAQTTAEELSAIPNTVNFHVDSEEERLMRRAEKLLALAQSDNEHEAYLAMERVRELYLKHNLSNLAQGKTQEYSSLIIETGKFRLERSERKIFSILNAHYFVEAISFTGFIAKTAKPQQCFELLGTPSNLKMAEYVYHFLKNQLPIMWRHYSKTQNKAGDRRSYQYGVLTGFDDKLFNQRHETQSRVVTGLSAEGIVPSGNIEALLKSQEKALSEYVKYRFPKLQYRSSSRLSVDSASFSAGITDGKRLNIQRPIHTGHQGQQRLLPS